MQKFNIWHTWNFTFAENRDATLERAGRESYHPGPVQASSKTTATLFAKFCLPNKLFLCSHLVKGMIMDLKMRITPPTKLRKPQGDLTASKVHANRKSHTWCVQHVHLCVDIFICMYSINKHSFPAALLVIRETEKQLAEMAQCTPKPMRTPSAAALKHGHSNVSKHFQVITWRSCLMYKPIQQIN